MPRSKTLESLTTRFFLLTVFVTVGVIVAALGILLWQEVATVDQLSKAVDAIFKATAIVVGALWALNRYYIGRTDVPQLRVDPTIDFIPGKEPDGFGLLVYRLDVVNTGKTLIPTYQQFLRLDSVHALQNGVVHDEITRWPLEGTSNGGPTEPGSWSAINNAHPIPPGTTAVRLYLEIKLVPEKTWTWHQTFKLVKPTSVT